MINNFQELYKFENNRNLLILDWEDTLYYNDTISRPFLKAFVAYAVKKFNVICVTPDFKDIGREDEITKLNIHLFKSNGNDWNSNNRIYGIINRCYNKDKLPLINIGNCWCAAPKSCTCVNNKCTSSPEE